MNSKKQSEKNLISVIGYGTFITRRYWSDKKNVDIVHVKNYSRIFPEGNWYPYVLKSEGSSFWALKFDINEEELEQLDVYEGVPLGLFERVKIEVLLSNQKKIEAYIYVPTEETIKTQNLSLSQDIHDRWKEEIKKYPKIMSRFPKLIDS